MTLIAKFVAVLAGLAVVASLCLAADKKQISDAFAAVDANLKTAAGKQYDEQVGKEFSARYVSSVRQCKQSASGSSLDPFDILLQLDREGKVRESLVYPETPISTCTRSALANVSFSAPPHADYWINVHMQLKH